MNGKLLLTLCLAFSERCVAEGLDAKEHTDKFAHFGLSCTLTASALTVGKAFDSNHRASLGNRSAAAAFGFGLGFYKEFRDIREGGSFAASQGDLVADLLGIISAQLIHWDF